MTEEKPTPAEPVTEPVTDPATEQVAEQVTEKVTEQATEQVAEQITDPVSNAEPDQHTADGDASIDQDTRQEDAAEPAKNGTKEDKPSKPVSKKKKAVRGDSTPLTPEEPLDVGTVVLAKVKGYPSWPGIIVPESFVSAEVLAAKPKSVGGRRKTGSSPHSIYLVRFFVETSYAWTTRSDIQLLTPADAREYLKKNKKYKRLISAYEVALAPPTLRQVEAEIKETARDEPKRKRAAPKKKENAAQDVFDPDSERDAQGAASTGLAAGPKRKGTTTVAPRKRAKNESEMADAASSKETFNHIRSIRHRLQRMYIKDTSPQKAQLLSVMVKHLSEMGPIDLSIIKETKIKKVLNIILKRLDTIEETEKYDIKSRILDLVRSWTEGDAYHSQQDNESRASPESK